MIKQRHEKITPPVDGITINLEALLKLRYYADGINLSSRNIMQHQQGSYISNFRGRGIDFDEVRVYQAGDDIRHMDWRVTARTNSPHIKLYKEEKERAIWILTDVSPNMFFGTRQQFKSVAAAKTAALLAWAGALQGDRIGGMTFSNQLSSVLKPAPGKRGIYALLKQLVDKPLESGASHAGLLNHALQALRPLIKPGSLLIILSDFSTFDQNAKIQLQQINRYNDILAGYIYDPLEANLPAANRYGFSNGEKFVVLDTTNPQLCHTYQQRFLNNLTQIKQFFSQQAIRCIELQTSQDIVNVLQRQLNKNRKKAGSH